MSPKILIVEDDPVTRRIIDTQLRAAGYETTLGSDGMTALRLAHKEKPDLVVLDLGLPGGDGFNVMQRFKQLTPLSTIPVIVFSARDPAEWKERALKAGAVAFLPKPLDSQELLTIVKSQLAAVSRQASGEGQAKKILIIEDDADTRLALSIRLKAGGYAVALAADAVSAVSVGLKEKPHLILLDLGLPAGDGFVLMDRLKKHPVLERTPIIVLTALDPAVNKDRALRSGAAAFFSKPADNQELLAAIQETIHKAEAGS
jgi:DNA-binding response OmpR family regulator